MEEKKRERRIGNPVPPPYEGQKEDEVRWAGSIKPNYAEIRARYLSICTFGAIIVLAFQIALILIFEFHLLPIEFKTSRLVHYLKYLIIPSTLNFGAVLAARLIDRRYRKNEFILNMSSIAAMVVVCSVTASAHQVYSITLMLVCLPVLMVAVFGDPKMLYITSALGALGVASAAVCRALSPYRQDPKDTKLIPEISAAFALLVVSALIGLVMIRLLSVQKLRLLNAVRESKAAQREARIANQAKTEFLANMSHEIRTPLNAVVGMTDMILRKAGDSEIAEYAVDIQQASNLLLAIISDILDISKIESGKMEIKETRYELGSLINDSYNMVAGRCREKGLTMKVICDPDLPRMLVGDEYHLRQILVNLLSNAVKYTNEGGVEFHVSGEENGDILRIEVRVKDTGVGIRKEDIPHLFEKFSRMDLVQNRQVEGTGLGLSITKQLIDLMHGTIQVESVYGVGSLFTVRIPQKIADRTPIGDIYVTYLDMHGFIEEYHQSFEAPEARILVVDDVPVNLQVIRRLLEATKVQVDTAASGMEGLMLLRENRYDVILMDHMMPVMNGVETLKAMRELPESKNLDVPVIMLTANAMQGAREDYLKEGFTDYLSKPVRGARLEDMILKYLPAEKITTLERDRRSAPAAPAAAEETTPEKAPAEEAAPENGNGLARLSRLLPEVDTATGLAYCADDESFYCSMLAEFSSDDRAERMEQAFRAEDWPTYQREAHSLKSAARMVGLNGLSDEALALESAAKALDLDAIRAGHGKTAAHYRDVVRALKSWLE